LFWPNVASTGRTVMDMEKTRRLRYLGAHLLSFGAVLTLT
jgi:hypothetical protein